VDAFSWRVPKPKRDEVLAFLSLVWEVDHELRRVSKNMQKTMGVTGPQRLVIRALGRTPGLSAGELAQTLRLHPSTMTGLLARLEDANLVSRGRDPDDARRHTLSLTARGRTLDVEAGGTVEDAAKLALASVKRKTRREGAALLTALAQALRSAHGGDVETD
jgi:MarR family transcriptional regulator, organic hydroperoxide resistance regulator